jgi:hypothetical protein
MELKEIRKRVAKDLKDLRSDMLLIEKLKYLRDVYANATSALLAEGFNESAKLQVQFWKYVDNLIRYMIYVNLRNFEMKKTFEKTIGWR